MYVSIILGGRFNSLFFQKDRHFNSIICKKQTNKKIIISQWTEILSLPYTHIYIHMQAYSQTYSVAHYFISCFTNLFTHLSQYYILEYFYFKRIVDNFNLIPKNIY